LNTVDSIARPDPDFFSIIIAQLDFSTVNDFHRLHRPLFGVGGDSGNSMDNIHARYYSAKDTMFAIQMGETFQSKEELRTIAVRSVVGHG